jgi:type IV secretory pathway TraG/TraD family ATPase VirD4
MSSLIPAVTRPVSPSPSQCSGGVFVCPQRYTPSHLASEIPWGYIALAAVVLLVVLWILWRLRPPHPGMAGPLALIRHASALAVRWQSRQTRPSLGLRRWVVPACEVGFTLGRTLMRPTRYLWSGFADCILMIGIPGQGKDTLAGNWIIDAPGAVVYATTKPDDLQPLIRLRALKGPIVLFNPEDLGGITSTMRNSPINGCRDPQVAIETAGLLLMGSSLTKGMKYEDFFTGSAGKVLRSLLIAAAVSDGTLLDVYRWCSDESDTEPLDLLERASAAEDGRYDAFIGDLRGVIGSAAQVTSGSVYQTLSTTLQFCAYPAVATTLDVRPDEGGFDVDAFIGARATLFLLGADRESGSTAPLLTCLIGRAISDARKIASTMRGGRLDPPMLLCFNEASKIVPMPIDKYFADHRALGLPTIAMVQSRAHLLDRWGRDRGKAIEDTAPVNIAFGGSTDEDYLRGLSALAGTYVHREPVIEHASPGYGRRTRHERERREVLPPAEIRMLPRFCFLLIRANLQPVKARARKVWKRRDVRRAAKRSPGWPATYAAVTPPMVDAVNAARRAYKMIPWWNRRARRQARSTGWEPYLDTGPQDSRDRVPDQAGA